MYKLQSVLLSREVYSLEDAVRWLVKNGFDVKKIDGTQHFWRFRQINPSKLRKEGYNNFRTKDISPHIKFIFGYKENNAINTITA